MEGADESTELWRHPRIFFIDSVQGFDDLYNGTIEQVVGSNLLRIFYVNFWRNKNVIFILN